jgi:hypothetical protein
MARQVTVATLVASAVIPAITVQVAIQSALHALKVFTHQKGLRVVWYVLHTICLPFCFVFILSLFAFQRFCVVIESFCIQTPFYFCTLSHMIMCNIIID